MAATEVLVGAAGVVAGAGVTGLTQVVVTWREHVHVREERRLEKKRDLYERYLRLVSGLVSDTWDAVAKSEQNAFNMALSRVLSELRVGIMLDASPSVGRSLKALTGKVQEWATEYPKRTAPGQSVVDAMNAAFDEVVYPQMLATADLMAAEIGSR